MLPRLLKIMDAITLPHENMWHLCAKLSLRRLKRLKVNIINRGASPMDDPEGYSLDDLARALENIDVFLKTLVQKMTEDEPENTDSVEPMEKLLRVRDIIVDETLEPNPLEKTLIPLPQLDEPLIDVFEDENHIKVLMQCRCREQNVTIFREADGLKLCTKECQKVRIPLTRLQVEHMISKCNNNEVFEVDIPKVKDQ